jgi:hypothetical protein
MESACNNPEVVELLANPLYLVAKTEPIPRNGENSDPKKSRDRLIRQRKISYIFSDGGSFVLAAKPRRTEESA